MRSWGESWTKRFKKTKSNCHFWRARSKNWALGAKGGYCACPLHPAPQSGGRAPKPPLPLTCGHTRCRCCCSISQSENSCGNLWSCYSKYLNELPPESQYQAFPRWSFSYSSSPLTLVHLLQQFFHIIKIYNVINLTHTHHPFSCLFFSVQLRLPGLLLLSIPWKHFQLYFPFLFLLCFPGKSTPDLTNHLSFLYLCLNSKGNWIKSPTVELTNFALPQVSAGHSTLPV